MEWFKRVWSKLSRKVLYVVAAFVLEGVRVRFPDAPLPPADLVVDLVLALMLTHGATDVAHLVGVAVGEWAKGRDGGKAGLPSSDG